jgi:hypothetical protein
VTGAPLALRQSLPSPVSPPCSVAGWW